MADRVTRRAFLVGLAGVATISMPAIAQDDGDEVHFPYLPKAVAAEYVGFSQLDDPTLDTEPIAIMFYGFGYDDIDSATSDYPTISEFYRKELISAVEPGESVQEVGIGRIGDERTAFIHDDDNPTLTTIVRLESSVLVTISFAMGGDLPRYMAKLLRDLLPEQVDAPSTLVPDLLDMPEGWDEAGRTDILETVHDKDAPR